MSSDPIEVLRAVAAFSLPEDHLLADDIEEGEYPDDQSSDYFFRYGTIRAARRALASLSAPKGDLTVEELVEMLGGIVYEFSDGHHEVGFREGVEIDDYLKAAVTKLNARMAAPKPESEWALVRKELLDSFPEINPSNYDHDAACALNEWGAELVTSAVPAPKPESAEAVAWHVIGDDGSLIADSTSESYAREVASRWEYRGSRVRPLVYADTAPPRPEASDPVAELVSRQQPLGQEHGEVLAAHLGEFLDTAPQQASAPDATAVREERLASWMINNLLNESQLSVVPPGQQKALRYLAQQPAADPLVEWANSPLNFTATVGVFKDGVQHAAVDGAKCEATHCCPSCGRCYGCAKPAIDHLEGQQQGGES